MKKIGLLSGLSWLSTRIYYDKINSMISNRAGIANSAKLVMSDINTKEYLQLIEDKQFSKIESKLLEEIKIIENAGTACIGITCNTLHYFLDNIADQINIPVFHILKIINQQLATTNIKTVGVISTKYSIQLELHRNYFKKIGINTIYPSNNENHYVNSSLVEIGKGLNLEEIQSNIIGIINQLITNGAELIILGASELSLVINQSHFDVPVIDTSLLHAVSLAEYALEETTGSALYLTH